MKMQTDVKAGLLGIGVVIGIGVFLGGGHCGCNNRCNSSC
jgi:hypothetical protein